MGKSLVRSGKYEVHIIGSGMPPKTEAEIKFHPVGGSRNIMSRLLRQLRVCRIINREQPDVLIISTHELLIPAVIYRIVRRKKIIYDIRENYNFNLRYQKIYPWLLREILAFYIRTKEVILSGFFNRFLLAEQCYLEEINFLKKKAAKCLVLENKCGRIFPLQNSPEEDDIQLLLSGTISEIYGAREAVAFFKKLPADKFSLTIIGHCPSNRLREYLEAEAKAYPGLQLILDQAPIPYEQIAARFTEKTIGILPYRDNKSVEKKYPTKLFEYLANNIPVLISPNPRWQTLIEKHHGGHSINFNRTPKEADLAIFFTLINNIHITDKQFLMWQYKENEFLQTIEETLEN